MGADSAERIKCEFVTTTAAGAGHLRRESKELLFNMCDGQREADDASLGAQWRAASNNSIHLAARLAGPTVISCSLPAPTPLSVRAKAALEEQSLRPPSTMASSAASGAKHLFKL